MSTLQDDIDDDEALRQAIALSLEEGGDSVIESTSPPASTDQGSRHPQDAFDLLSLDRAKMEMERLDRLTRKRRASSDSDVVEVPPPKRRAAELPPSNDQARLDVDNTLLYQHGAVKRTWARGYPRSGDDISIEEVFQKDQLLLALLSSFQWDEEWMLSKLDMAKTKVILLAFANDDAQKDAMRANVPSNIRFCFPPMNGPGAMHSKLQILKYPGYLRIVTPTGNLVPYDWGETGVMENMLFLIDLPRLNDFTTHARTRFSSELERFLQATGADNKLIDSLKKYDFSKTVDLGFVYSIPGGHSGEALKRTGWYPRAVEESRVTAQWLINMLGYCGLGASIATLGLSAVEPIEVDLTSASLGFLSYDLIRAIYNACQGDDGMKEFNTRAVRKQKSSPSSLVERFRIYFPTKRTVHKSRGGSQAAGTICVQSKWWRSPKFPTELVRDCVNTRGGLLMHTKAIFVRRQVAKESSSTAKQAAGWAYVGSANLSESAWGRVVKDKATGNAKMSCRNWECGVVVPVDTGVSRDEAQGGLGENQASSMSIFNNKVPVPMQVPGPTYGATDEPWFFLEA